MTEHILSLSYGKDSIACLGAIEKLGWPLDRIVTADVWATDTIPADLPPMVEFKAHADKTIKERWGIEVEHLRAKRCYQDVFYMTCNGKYSHIAGKIYGWPFQRGPWCNSRLKQRVFEKFQKGAVQYIGIAADEPRRFHSLNGAKKIAACGTWLGGSRLPPLVQGKRPAFADLHDRNARRVLVLPQPGRGAAAAVEKHLPGVLGADAEMGRRQPRDV